MFRKIIASLLLALILLVSIFTPYAHAQTINPWYMQTYKQWYIKVFDTNVSPPQEIFGERYTAAQVTWVVYGLISFILNMDGDTQRMSCLINSGDIADCLAQRPLFSYNTKGVPEDQKSVLAVIFSEKRSLSGVNYIRSKLTSLKIIPETQAQVINGGFGFEALNPVQRIWKAFRDVMYGFFVLIIIVYAFMIMFRTKISPQTVVTVQSALPKVIITLILVTFSYAIAGFLIDIMYLLIGLIALIFSNIGIFDSNIPNHTTWQDLFNLLTVGPPRYAFGVLGWFIVYILPFVAALVGVIFSTNGGLGGGTTIGILGVLAGLFILLGMLLWLLITVVKVFIMLIKAYLSILISVIFAPLMIGFGAITPTGGFGAWLRGLVSNLLVYPVTGVFLLLSFIFLGSSYNVVGATVSVGLDIGMTSIFDQQSSFWYPPLTLGSQSGTWDPLPILWLFASLSVLAMTPKVVDTIKSIMSGKGIEGGSGIGAAFGAVGGYALGAARGTGRAANTMIGTAALMPSKISDYRRGKEISRLQEATTEAHITADAARESTESAAAYEAQRKLEKTRTLRNIFKR